nr:reverse transcriptase domain-containing protein [Tanacetum cinerariifolium]
MMASLLQMNTASTSGSETLSGNTIANPKGELKAITTQSGLVTEGPTVPNPPKSVNLEEDECVEETYMDPDHAEYNIKVPPPPLVQKPKPPIQRNFVLHTRDSLPPRIPYPSRMLKQKQQEKDDIQIQKFWNIFKQLHLNITLAEALVLMPKYQKMLKALLSNKEKIQELANTPLNENCSAVILKKLPEKLGDPGKFLIPRRFSELKCKALADLGASINLMPLEEVYVSQLDGFVDQDNPNHMYKIKKALYGLKQAPRAWYDMLSSFMISQDFSKSSVNLTLFIHRNDNDLLLVQIYVDDIILAASTPELSFADADRAGCQDTRRSTSGSLQFLGERLISWSSKRPKSAAISSTKAEYIALSGCCAQFLWMRSQLMNYGLGFNEIPIYHFIKEQVDNRVIELYFVNTEYQLADLFTKALSRDRIEFLINKLGMRSFTPETLRQLTNEVDE